jgi:hypothetical protein
MGTGVLSSGIKRPRCEANHSSPRLRLRGGIPPLPVRLHGAIMNAHLDVGTVDIKTC